MAKKFIAPDLSNATPQFLLDEMGTLSVMENHIKRLRAFYKEAYFARTGIKETVDGDYTFDDKAIPETGVIKEGETFIATTTRTTPSRFDQTAFAEDDPETFEKYKKSKPQLTTRFALREGVVNPVVNDLLEQLKKELDLD